MGNTLTSFSNFLVPTKPCRFLLLGLDASGKSTLLYRWTLREAVMTIPTIGVNIEEGRLVDGSVVQAWDVGGRDKLRTVLSLHYYPDSDALIYCEDSSDLDRMIQARDELHHVLQSEDIQAKTLLLFLQQARSSRGATHRRHYPKIGNWR